jgi:hypothetical protein
MCNVRNVKCNVQTGVLAGVALSASVDSRGEQEHQDGGHEVDEYNYFERFWKQTESFG